MTEMYGGNTPIVPDETDAEWELEEKLRRATEKVMERNHTGKGTEVTSSPKPIIIHEGNDIIVNGVRYKRVETPQSFYDKLWGLLKTKLGDSVECDEMADRVRDLIREHIPECKKGMGLPEYCVGWNDAIKAVNLELFNGIQ